MAELEPTSFGEFLAHFPDRAIQWASEDPSLFGEIARCIVPRSFHQRLDFAAAVNSPRELLTTGLDLRQTDILYHVPCSPLPPERGMRYPIHFHLEQQYKLQWWFRARETAYRGLVWEKEIRRWETDKVPAAEWKLTPLLSVMLYTPRKAWGGPRRLAAWEQPPDWERMRRADPDWGFHFVRLHGFTPRALLDAGTAGGLVLLLLREERAPLASLVETLEATFTVLEQLPLEVAPRWLRVVQIQWALVHRRRPRVEFPRLSGMLERYVERSKFRQGVEGTKMGQTMYDYLLATGRREGRRETTHDILLEVLGTRFAGVPPEVIARVEQAETDEARLWLRRALTADHLEDVGIVASGAE